MKKISRILLIAVMMVTIVGCSQNKVNTTVENGDVVVIDFVGKVDGVAFDGGSATDQMLEIGAGRFIPGFEEGIEGMKLSETKDIEVTFPENYVEDLSGKKAVFTITVQKLYKEVKK